MHAYHAIVIHLPMEIAVYPNDFSSSNVYDMQHVTCAYGISLVRISYFSKITRDGQCRCDK